ncbi:MAG TPA: ABC transporter ATP-binding protein [Sphingobacteriaceae bacterium]|nr:ABC transporter ATP-binding protein [Sphingobacteriaceae bacterium]
MLQVDGINVAYGQVRVLHQVSLHVNAGEVVCLLGANGAGKTTFLRTLSGLLRPTDGSIHFQGMRIDGMAPEDIVAQGIIHVPQGRRIFPGLTVYENLIVSTLARKGLKTPRPEALERVYHLFPRLAERKQQMGWSLSGGEQQMLAVGRALMAEPKLLLLDEPSMGLSPVVLEELYGAIRESLKDGDLTVLLVEQNTQVALEVAHRGYVLESGRIVLEGTAAELLDNPKVQEAYLG